MARRKTLPDSVRAKCSLAERLGALRAELFGERGGPELARRLGIPVRTWYNYEAGVTIPAEIVLRIIGGCKQLIFADPLYITRRGPSSAAGRSTLPEIRASHRMIRNSRFPDRNS